MNDYKADKPTPSDDLASIAEHLSGQPEKLDREFWKEYFYWSWRCLLFVLFIALATSMDLNESPTLWFNHISKTKWAIIVLTPILIGPLIVIGWSYV